MRNQRNAEGVRGRHNVELVKGHINAQDVNRHNVEVVNQGAKQENVVEGKHAP